MPRLAIMLLACVVGGCTPLADEPTEPSRRGYPWLGTEIKLRRIRSHWNAVRRNAEAARRCEIAHALKPLLLAGLYGGKPGTPGPAVGDVQLADEYAEHTVVVADRRTPGCWVRDDVAIDCPFACVDDPERDCRELHAQLDTAWGPSPGRVWFDARRRVRVSLREDPACTLVFARLSSRPWLGWSANAPVPIGIIGTKRFRDLRWPIPPIGTFVREADVSVCHESSSHRVTGLLVIGYAPDDKAELEAQLARFRRHVPIKLDFDDEGFFEITIGRCDG